MARVYLTCVANQSGAADDAQRAAALVLRKAAEEDRHGQHTLVDDPGLADLVVFAEVHNDDSASGPYFEALRRDTIYRRFREKAVVISGMDRVIPLVPGIYASMEAGWHRAPIARPGPYYLEPNPYLKHRPLDAMPGEVRWLASFIGCVAEVPVRKRLLEVSHPRLLIQDNTRAFIGAIRSGQDEQLAQFKRDYVETSLDSKFILCPRGAGTSSIRLYEAMEMGRAPVVLSDGWVAPSGPDWDGFCIRIPEREVAQLPEILGAREHEAVAMGAAARRAWEQHFGPDALFHWTVEEALKIRQSNRRSKDLACSLARLQFLRPFHLRRRYRRLKTGVRRLLGPRR